MATNVPAETVKEFADLKAEGYTSFLLDRNEDGINLGIAGQGDPTTQAGYRAYVEDLKATFHNEAVLIYAITGSDGQTKWVLLEWTNAHSRDYEIHIAWRGLGPSIAKQLGGIAKVTVHTSVEFESDYERSIAPELADL